jgi:hypothetical protein
MKRRAISKSIIYTPFVLAMSYVCGSMVLYWAGPIDWPTTNALHLAIFQALAIFAIAVGYWSVATRSPTLTSGVSLRPFFRTGVLLTLALQIPVTLTYTNKYPWDVFQAVMDQRTTYEDMLEQIVSQHGSRFYVPLFRSIAMPFFYAALTYGVLHFKTLSRLDRVLLLLLILCPVNLSLLRGTDKEIFDIAVILGGLGLVHFGRRHGLIENPFKLSARRVAIWVLTAATVSSGIFTIFAFRKYERLGTTDEFCFADNLICADHSGLVLSALPEFVSFGISMFTFYLTNGYYGLSLALDQPFSFAYGIGHSSALMSLSERISGASLLDSTFIGKVSAEGWDHRYYWSTIFAWIANDVGFFGSLVVIGVVGRWFCQSWVDSAFSNNDCAAIVFVLLCLLFFYLPANNQIAQTFDLYFAFVAALVAWKLPRSVNGFS